MDFIDSSIYGDMSFSPQDQLKKENLDWLENEVGRSRLDIAITIGMQVGVYFGKNDSKILDKVRDLENNLEFYKEMYEISNEKVKKLLLLQMPDEGYSDEIKKLREEVRELKKQKDELNVYKQAIIDIQNRFK